MWQACHWCVLGTSGKSAWLEQSELEKVVGDVVSSLSIMRGSCCQVQKVRLWLSPPLQGGPQIIHSEYNLPCDVGCVAASIGHYAIWNPPPLNFNLIWEISFHKVTWIPSDLRLLICCRGRKSTLSEHFGTWPMVAPGLSCCLSHVLRTLYFHFSFRPCFSHPPPLLKILICVVREPPFSVSRTSYTYTRKLFQWNALS